jgi:hypothetical protein
MTGEPEDLAFLRAVYARISGTDPGWREVATLIAREPGGAPSMMIKRR